METDFLATDISWDGVNCKVKPTRGITEDLGWIPDDLHVPQIGSFTYDNPTYHVDTSSDWKYSI